ncbi:arabinose transporter [Caballeronia grimmiae]|uniref:arabinose transporter n=1 Tax=Caballeronia grimmiae TaxID=1071679 RepID=UPI0038BB7A58
MSDSRLKGSAGRSVVARLFPIMTAVLVGFLVIGVALPVLPLHVTNDLGFGPLVVGLVAGAQFAAALLSRIWAGSYSDRRGAKRSVFVGLLAAAAAGLLYLVSIAFLKEPPISVAILLVGRAVLGGAESFIITGGIAWGLGLVERQHAGKVIAWVGTAMFAAMALGGPLGSILYTSFGFVAIALMTALLPLFVFAYVSQTPAAILPSHGQHACFNVILSAVWLPGVGAALASMGYCAILAFSSLFFVDMQWQPVWMAFTAFGAALIAARTIAGHLPDRLGGARVAFLFVIVQVAGLLLMGVAKTTLLASLGAALSGVGYSLVYPGLGVEAVRTIAPRNRGMAMGLYTAFLDVAMALGSPFLGWVGGHVGLRSVFLASAMIVGCAAAVAIQVERRHHVTA